MPGPSWRFPHLKRSAVDDAKNHRGEAIVVGLGAPYNFADGWRVVRFDAATKREGEQFFAERAGKQFRTLEQPAFESRHAGERAAVRQAARGVDGFVVFRGAPAADGVEIFQGKTDGIHDVVTTRARGICPVSREACAHRQRRRDSVVVERGHVGRRGRRRFASERRENPVTANHRRGARGVRGDSENAALPQQAAALALGVVRERNEVANSLEKLFM